MLFYRHPTCQQQLFFRSCSSIFIIFALNFLSSRVQCDHSVIPVSSSSSSSSSSSLSSSASSPQSSSSQSNHQPFKCPEKFGYYPDKSNCSKYYVCVFGEPLHESCTGGLHFSHELQTCDWPRNVECAIENGGTVNNKQKTPPQQQQQQPGVSSSPSPKTSQSSSSRNREGDDIEIDIEDPVGLSLGVEDDLGSSDNSNSGNNDGNRDGGNDGSLHGNDDGSEIIYDYNSGEIIEIKDREKDRRKSVLTGNSDLNKQVSDQFSDLQRSSRGRSGPSSSHSINENQNNNNNRPKSRVRSSQTSSISGYNGGNIIGRSVSGNSDGKNINNLPTTITIDNDQDHHQGVTDKSITSDHSNNNNNQEPSSDNNKLIKDLNSPGYADEAIAAIVDENGGVHIEDGDGTIYGIVASNNGQNSDSSSSLSSAYRQLSANQLRANINDERDADKSAATLNKRRVSKLISSTNRTRPVVTTTSVVGNAKQSFLNANSNNNNNNRYQKLSQQQFFDSNNNNNHRVTQTQSARPFLVNDGNHHLPGNFHEINLELVRANQNTQSNQNLNNHRIRGYEAELIARIPGEKARTTPEELSRNAANAGASIQRQPTRTSRGQRIHIINTNRSTSYVPVVENHSEIDFRRLPAVPASYLPSPSVVQQIVPTSSPPNRVPARRASTTTTIAPTSTTSTLPPSPPRYLTTERHHSYLTNSRNSQNNKVIASQQPRYQVVVPLRSPSASHSSSPSRPPSRYSTPDPLSNALKCDDKVCRLPDCRCGGTEIPNNIPADQVPQIVLITFDDAINDINWQIYDEIFNTGRKNPNGCPIRGTFYVSHEWTDYGMVQTLYSMGHEIASHSVTHSFGERFSKSQWFKEIAGQREIVHLYGGVRMEDIRGMRAPFLQVGGNKQFEMLFDANFTYDSSMPVFENNPPFWPYTLDYQINHECMITPCPTKSFPGLWEIGMVMWQDLRGGRCSMGDACSNPSDEDGVHQMLMKNFNRHYNSNRAPFGLYYHSAWFNTDHHRRGFLRFMDEILAKKDVYFLTKWQLIQWLRQPVSMNEIYKLQGWQCGNNYNLPPPCHSPNICNVVSKSGARFFKTCQPCPLSYPWLGNTNGLNGEEKREGPEERIKR